MFQCFILHVTISKMHCKFFYAKTFSLMLQNICKMLQMFEHVEHVLKIGGGYIIK